MAGKGQAKTGGRKKGTPNKTTTVVKDMIIIALEESGGVNYLKEQARKNPAAFMSLVGKVLPLQITGDAASPVEIRVVDFSKAREEYANHADPA